MVRIDPSPNVSQSVELDTGVRLPLLGLGTTHSGGYCHDAVVYALKDCQYRLIDTAKRYGVEDKLGKAIRDSGVAREDLFLISKLWPTDFGNTRAAFEDSCRRLGTNYLDSYLFHSPEVPDWLSSDTPARVREDSWRVLELLYEAERVRSIGVSNYDQTNLEELLDVCSVNPHINQVEFHPYQNPHELRHFCRENKIQFMGYCPLAKGTILSEKPVVAIAERLNRTPAQVCIRWSIQQNIPAIPKSTKPQRLRENSLVFDFSLPTNDMACLNSLNDNRRLVSLENWQEKFDLPDGYKLNNKALSARTIPTVTTPKLVFSH